MATVKAHGFTIIELMLFLGVTGALFAALMFGVNTNITQQRYRESVQAYASLLENQYFEVLNPRNERSNDLQCGKDGTISQSVGGGQTRGTTSCVLLGKAIEIGNRGTIVRVANVVGVEPDENTATSDIEALIDHKPRLFTTFGSETESSIDWQSSLVTTEGLPSEASMLLLRSPSSGLLRVFTSVKSLETDLASMITPDSSSASGVLVNCVQGQTGSAPLQSVTIDPRIAGPQGVIVKEADPACAA